MKRPSRPILLLAAVAGAVGLVAPRLPSANGRPARHLVLISIDGLLPKDLSPTSGRGLRLPTLERLGRTGVIAEGVRGVYPSLTFPSYATLATGVRPARHGILQNTPFPLPGDEWRFEAAGLRAPTLWQRASAAGLVTAAVSWPLTLGASIDVLIPAVPMPLDEKAWPALVRRSSSPGLVDEVLSAMGEPDSRGGPDPGWRDHFTTAAAAHILKTRRPNLLLVRLVETGLTRYIRGPAARAVDSALVRLDERLGLIVSAAEEGGLAGRTTFVITGDHGFREAHTVLQPNVILRRAGLLETASNGSVSTWRAVAQKGAIHLADPGDLHTALRVRDLFRSLSEGPHRGIFRLVERQELDALAADPTALFFLEPSVGYAVNEWFDGDAFLAPAPTRGYHGFLPDSPGMTTGLLLSGAAIHPGRPLPVVRQVDLAPTVAHPLGFDMPETEGSPLVSAVADGGHD